MTTIIPEMCDDHDANNCLKGYAALHNAKSIQTRIVGMSTYK